MEAKKPRVQEAEEEVKKWEKPKWTATAMPDLKNRQFYQEDIGRKHVNCCPSEHDRDIRGRNVPATIYTIPPDAFEVHVTAGEKPRLYYCAVCRTFFAEGCTKSINKNDPSFIMFARLVFCFQWKDGHLWSHNMPLWIGETHPPTEEAFIAEFREAKFKVHAGHQSL